MGRLTPIRERLIPRAAGPDYGWIWSAFAVTNLGDGIALAAGPLLVASITREPAAVAGAVFVQRLPWVLFSLFAGAIIDRVDRRSLIMLVNGLRALALTVLAVAIATGALSLGLLYVLLFAVGTAETFADNASSTLVAVTVPKPVLGVANARIVGVRIVTNQLAGPPLGAVLFAASAALPFGLNAIGFALGVLLVARVRPAEPRGGVVRRSLRADIVEGGRWLWGHDAVRTLVLLIAAFNITFGAAFSIWVLYALERLGLDELGFGLLLTVSAVGGVLGSAAYAWLEDRFTYATLLRVGLLIETFTHAALALTRSPIVAGAVMFLFGIHAVVWGTLSNTIRLASVPDELQGRVQSIYMLGVIGSLAVGSAIGGGLAQAFGILAPFWFAFGGAALTTALVWPQISHVAHAAD